MFQESQKKKKNHADTWRSFMLISYSAIILGIELLAES